MRLFAALLLIASSLPAQIDALSATASGDEVFFTTWLRPAGTDHSNWRKAYRLDALRQATLVAQEEGELWQVDGVSPSSDGSVLGVNRSNPCNIGTPCVGILQEFSEIRDPRRTLNFEGHAEVGAAGRFVLLRRTTGFGFVPGEELLARQIQRVDLSAAEPVPVPLGVRPAPRGRWLTDDGTALVGRTEGGVWLLAPVEGEPITIGFPNSTPMAAFLLPDASAVVYQAAGPIADPQQEPPGELRIRRADGTETSLGASGRLVDVSRDGRVLLYTAEDNDGAVDLVTLQLPAGAPRQVATIAGDVGPVALLPDAGAALAVHDGRLLRIDLNSGQADTLLGPLPNVDQGDDYPYTKKVYRETHVPGSTYRVSGARLASETTIAPLPAGPELDGIRVHVNGVPAAVLWTSPFEVGYQVDWATPTAVDTTVVISHGSSGWEAATAILEVREQWVASALPTFGSVTLAVHQGFDRLVTAADPALPGEYIHLYATGLGAVEPPVETGHASPSSPLAVTASPRAWTVYDRRGERPGDVVFAGLAPGLVGFYQIVVRIPVDVDGQVLGLRFEGNGFLGEVPVRSAAIP